MKTLDNYDIKEGESCWLSLKCRKHHLSSKPREAIYIGGESKLTDNTYLLAHPIDCDCRESEVVSIWKFNPINCKKMGSNDPRPRNWRGCLLPEDINIRFWRHVNKTDSCWEWVGRKHKFGYGVIVVDGKSKRASRVVWELTNGTIPEGLEVCHKCDNPPCVNPSHLFLGTHADNMKDMVKKGRVNALCGENNINAKLTWSQVSEIREVLKSYHHGLYRELARKYGVDQKIIHCIRDNKIWIVKEKK
jgi:hypothetical protein